MNNRNAQENINVCIAELQRIFHLIEGHGHTSSIVPFLTNYSIVRACGTIEYCFKTIISDLHSEHSLQIRNYVDNTIRNSSMNPSRDNICKTLKKFDNEWNTSFKEKLNTHDHSLRLKSSIDSLNNARNTFAHGNSASSSFENVRNYFNDCVIILELLDEVVSELESSS
jgi:hypothetical protein